jgi:Flp pilus assembly protein TadD
MVWNHHGYVLLELKRYAEAETVLRRAVSLDENLGSAWTYLGAASLRQGKFEQAVRELSRAAELSPESELAQDNLEEAQRAVEDAKKAQQKRQK